MTERKLKQQSASQNSRTQAKTAKCELKWKNVLEALWALWASGPPGLEPFGPGGPLGMEALWARRPFGPGGPLGLSLAPTISTTILLAGSERCFNPFSYFLIFLHMTLFFRKFIPTKPTALYNFFQAKMCRNVQTKISDRAPFGPRLSPTSSQNPKQKMEKKILLLTSQKINIIIDFFLIIIQFW